MGLLQRVFPHGCRRRWLWNEACGGKTKEVEKRYASGVLHHGAGGCCCGRCACTASSIPLFPHAAVLCWRCADIWNKCSGGMGKGVGPLSTEINFSSLGGWMLSPQPQLYSVLPPPLPLAFEIRSKAHRTWRIVRHSPCPFRCDGKTPGSDTPPSPDDIVSAREEHIVAASEGTLEVTSTPTPNGSDAEATTVV